MRKNRKSFTLFICRVFDPNFSNFSIKLYHTVLPDIEPGSDSIAFFTPSKSNVFPF